ncbi:MAG: hypothetical protein WKF31_05270 [Thermoleophilaceae bacterium]
MGARRLRGPRPRPGLGEWRSPFYLLALTALVLPATSLSSRRAFAYAVGFTLAYFAVSLGTGIDWATLDASPRLESLATHLMVPLLVALALSYSADLMERLRREAERSARLAVEAERRRIALDLHDSAKQRVHASHLVLSSVRGKLGEEPGSAGWTRPWASCEGPSPTWTRASPSWERRSTDGVSTRRCATVPRSSAARPM